MGRASRKKEGYPVAEKITVYCDPGLRHLIVNEAQAKSPRVTLSEVIVRILAAHYGDPALGVIPKKPMGRRPKEAAVA